MSILTWRSRRALLRQEEETDLLKLGLCSARSGLPQYASDNADDLCDTYLLYHYHLLPLLYPRDMSLLPSFQIFFY